MLRVFLHYIHVDLASCWNINLNERMNLLSFSSYVHVFFQRIVDLVLLKNWKNKIGDVFFFTKIKFSFDIRRSKQMECLHNSSEASGGDYKCREKKRMYLRINRAQDAYASYSIESRVKVIPRYVELPCERILLDSSYSSREKKEKLYRRKFFYRKPSTS